MLGGVGLCLVVVVVVVVVVVGLFLLVLVLVVLGAFPRARVVCQDQYTYRRFGIRKVTAAETRIFEHDMTNSTQQLQRINMHPTVEGHDMLVLLTDLIRPQTITLTGPQDEDLHKEANDRIEGLERHHSNISKDLGEMV